jgi:hypothetical protein
LSRSWSKEAQVLPGANMQLLIIALLLVLPLFSFAQYGAPSGYGQQPAAPYGQQPASPYGQQPAAPYGQQPRQQVPGQQPRTAAPGVQMPSNQNSANAGKKVYRHELVASQSIATYESAGGTSSLLARANYGYLIAKGLQIGALLEIGNISTTAGNISSTKIWGSIAYNLNSSWYISDSFYVKAMFGPTSANAGGSSSSSTGMAFVVGHRIPLWERVSWQPEGGSYKEGKADAYIKIIPLNFSIVF